MEWLWSADRAGVGAHRRQRFRRANQETHPCAFPSSANDGITLTIVTECSEQRSLGRDGRCGARRVAWSIGSLRSLSGMDSGCPSGR
jgi:hypothetical protein